MLAIRMQRTGRSGHAQFRLIVQEARRSPQSGNIVTSLGSYNPHTKQMSVDKEKTTFYIEHGAQPSSRVALLLKKEGIKLPKWVKIDTSKEDAIRNPEKRRSTRPANTEPAAPVEESVVATETIEETPQVAEDSSTETNVAIEAAQEDKKA